MNTKDVPRCMKASLAESKAYEDGERAGRAGLGPEANPWREKAPERLAGWTLNTDSAGNQVDHAARGSFAVCGPVLSALSHTAFDPASPYACRRCIRAVEAERKRLLTAWESGRLSTHPK